MKRKRLLWVCALVFAGVAFASFWYDHAVTVENAQRIREGMTFTQVLAILGPPTGADEGDFRPMWPKVRTWKRDGVRIDVAIAGGLVTHVGWEQEYAVQESLVDRVMRWLSQML
jgi:hypothetical protein